MKVKRITKLIINSPYEEPKQYWKYDPITSSFSLETGRRPAGYFVSSSGSEIHDDPGLLIELPLVNRIRSRVQAWRLAGYPGTTGISKRLLEYWNDPKERKELKFFFCQLEAIETLIWLTETSPADRQGIEINSDGGDVNRICTKMATGTGKTVVMVMLIAWQVLNKVTYPQDNRFSKNILVITPNLTVKERLKVLLPSDLQNYYEEFNIVPYGLWEKLRNGKIIIRNWHALNWETKEQLEQRKSVDKRGPKSDEAYVRDILADMRSSRNIIIINDEAHHAWRIKSKIKGLSKKEIDEATIWMGAVDRINKARGVRVCYDFSATPFVPTGRKGTSIDLFDWIVSDFSLNDAIESGLVKTPRIVIRDDGRLSSSYKSRLYHIYNDSEVRDDLNRRAKENEPLPDLVLNAYYLLGKDWLETSKFWLEKGYPTPPVMITVANTVYTAARVKFAFERHKIRIPEICVSERILHIDSKVLELSESTIDKIPFKEEEISKLSKKEIAEKLRRMVNTIGKLGDLGEQIQNVISVGMLSEGWDTKTVTHILGLRAFYSQLLCEQVVGRGLRRTSYEINPESNLFDSEYVNIFGVPFTFLPHESHEGSPKPPKPKNLITPLKDRIHYEIDWPNIVRIEHTFQPVLSLDMKKIKRLVLNAYETRLLAEIAPVVAGKPDLTKISVIKLEELGKKFRMQKIIFETARDIFDEMKPRWKGTDEILLVQLIKLVEQFITSGKIQILPKYFAKDDLKRQIIFTLNMNKIVQYIWEAIRFENAESIIPVFNTDHPIKSTGDMTPWYTSKPCASTRHSHINKCVYDSKWEASEAFELDRNPLVESWVKNDHLGFFIAYLFKGVTRKYYPDFIIKLKNGIKLVLEVKGRDFQKDKTKRAFLDEWVNAINTFKGFGEWRWDVSKNPADIRGILEKIGLN